MARTFVAIDIETTGLDPAADRIIEVAAVRFDVHGREWEHFQQVVAPGVAVPAFIERFTGLTAEMLAGAPALEAVLPGFTAFAGDDPLVGHNLGFDLRFLADAGFRSAGECFDTAELARLLLPGLPSHGLAEVARALEVGEDTHHRALADARTAAAVFVTLLGRLRRVDAGVRLQLGRFVASSDPALGRLIADSGPTAAQPGQLLPSVRPAPACVPLAPAAVRGAVTAADLDHAFAGAVRALDRFEHRDEQREMAEAVRQAVERGGHYLVEAGPGIGKSLAYLIPMAINAVRNGQRVVVSTNTIALQEQLLAKDIPALRAALVEAGVIGRPEDLRAALLKGRSNYLCLQRWAASMAAGQHDSDFARLAASMLLWLPETATGDRGELNLSPAERTAWQRFSAQDADCLARQNRFVREGECFLLRARQQAESAHILVVNHALLLADIASGGSAVPPFDHLVIDEAHNLEDVATAQFGSSLSLRGTFEALDGIYRRGGRDQREGGVVVMLRALPAAGFAGHATALQQAAERCLVLAANFFATAGKLTPSTGEDDRVLLSAAVRHGDGWAPVETSWDALFRGLRELEAQGAAAAGAIREGAAVEAADVLAAEVDSALRRVAEVRQLGQSLMDDPGPETIAWAGRDREGNGTLNTAPLEVGPRLWEELFSSTEAVVATSATLAAGNDMSFAARRLGFEDPAMFRFGSPFDYSRAALLAAVDDLPDPSARDFVEGVARAITGLTKASGGRALALFTSHTALRRAAGLVRPALEEAGIVVLAQGIDGTPRQLTSQLRDEPRTLVLGTSSFWEGIDVRGDALSMLIITKLPFGVPSDPVFKARSEEYADPFNQYSLPLAVLKFRQGFGRLIRGKEDTGVVAVADRRLWEKRYGRTFLDSLPPCTRFRGSVDEVAAASREWLAR